MWLGLVSFPSAMLPPGAAQPSLCVQALLHTTRRLLGTDVHLQLGALRAAANRAYGSHSATCAACGHGLGPAAARGVLLFRSVRPRRPPPSPH